MQSSGARIHQDVGHAAQERFQELRAELERLVGDDPRYVVCPADPVRDGTEFTGGIVIRPREPALDRYAEMRMAPCLAEVFLQPARSSAGRSVLALEEGYCVDTCEAGSAQELARVLLGILEAHLSWLDRVEDPEA